MTRVVRPLCWAKQFVWFYPKCDSQLVIIVRTQPYSSEPVRASSSTFFFTLLPTNTFNNPESNKWKICFPISYGLVDKWSTAHYNWFQVSIHRIPSCSEKSNYSWPFETYIVAADMIFCRLSHIGKGIICIAHGLGQNTSHDCKFATLSQKYKKIYLKLWKRYAL